jgi:hypothetical protein
MVAIKVANKVPKGAKTTPFGNQNPTEMRCFISGLRVDVKTAKPLCAGSIPARASKSQSLETPIKIQRTSTVEGISTRHGTPCRSRELVFRWSFPF